MVRFTAARLTVTLVVTALVVNAPSVSFRDRLLTEGIVGTQRSLTSVDAVDPESGRDRRFYVPETSVIRLSSGRYADGRSNLTDTEVTAAAVEGRQWLAAGKVPSVDRATRDMAERALLDMRLLTRSNGAHVASWAPYWRRVWPRDASWAAAAFSVTGHRREAFQILKFLAQRQHPDGTWSARYEVDGSAVVDGRPQQLDATGWVPWSVWLWFVTGDGDTQRTADMMQLWPMVRAAADAAASSLNDRGLPKPSPDYWEVAERRPTLGTAAPLRTGLRCAADLARREGSSSQAERSQGNYWSGAAHRLDTAIGRYFVGVHGYRRNTSTRSGADTAVTFLAPPFAPLTPEVADGIRRTRLNLAAQPGGVVPGEGWKWGTAVAWTAETALFSLAEAASGDRMSALGDVRWLAAHRTVLGALPERVAADGTAASVAPLGWTAATVLLALTAMTRPLPIPPAG
jgi:glucoamylase